MKHLARFALIVFLTTLSVQLLSCGSAEISSAKLYRQRRDYSKADQLLKQALISNPTDDEAWDLYVQNLYDLKNYEKIADVIDTASLYSVTHRADIDQIRQATWAQLYNGGLDAFNQNPESKEQQKAAIGLLESARKLAPDQPETYEILGQVYMAAGDTAKTIETFNQAIRQASSSHEQGTSLGLMLREPVASVTRAIGGDPARKLVVPITASDSALIYVYPSKQVYIYFERNPKAPHPWEVMGWRFATNEQLGLQPLRISTLPYTTVGNYYYSKGNVALAANNKSAAQDAYDKAIPLFFSVQRIDPTDEYSSSVIPEMYTKLDETDKAKEMYDKMLAQNPSKVMYTNYGNLLLRIKDYQGASQNYEKAIALDPSYETALFNLGATYKNWAAAEQEKNKKSPEIKTYLEKSTDYFEKLHAINHNDFNALANMIENYELLNKKEKTTPLLGELEALKKTEAANDPAYWELLGKLYARMNRSEESADAFKKADTLRR